MIRILVVDDEEGIRSFIAEVLEMEGYQVATAADGQEALMLLEEQVYTLLLTDLRMPEMDGMTLVRRAKSLQPELVVIVLTAHGSVDTAVEAMKLGAFDFLQKPLESPKKLRNLVEKALVHRKEVDSQVRHTQQDSTEDDTPLTYGASAMEPVLDALQKVARTKATVLLTGESGTGKEVTARKIHEWSPRSEQPFVAVNCAALSEHLLESELFGHEKGAFTGASERREGRIESAEGGTFFLDEIGEMKLDLQAKLLRVLQEKTYERVGGNQTLSCDVRWIAATNRNLPALVNEGLFREDLYHRLAVFPVELPPLRERREDIVPIANTLLRRIAEELGRDEVILSSEAEKAIATWDWPGNVRALSNALERAAILADGEPIGLEHIQPPHQAGVSFPSESSGSSDEPQSLADLEREAIITALASVDGNRRKAAEILGIGLRTLYDKLKKYDIS
ncbi:MAG: sigma-54-dependent Fis family transcriptional regulator [Deltaproteobacteria bacterium]|nr:MAG: sigma-54-dependent Fis family transcriptional regulator [Deltaproteobacteria bacterium]